MIVKELIQTELCCWQRIFHDNSELGEDNFTQNYIKHGSNRAHGLWGIHPPGKEAICWPAFRLVEACIRLYPQYGLDLWPSLPDLRTSLSPWEQLSPLLVWPSRALSPNINGEINITNQLLERGKPGGFAVAGDGFKLYEHNSDMCIYSWINNVLISNITFSNLNCCKQEMPFHQDIKSGSSSPRSQHT